MSSTEQRSVALVTLGCTRNEVDSEELAGRLAAEGWLLVDDADDADVAVVNTCGFVEQAKKDSIDVLLEASARKGQSKTQKVVAVGCLAERYGKQLAAELPEADAVLGFDSYADMSSHLRAILDGNAPESHTPGDRRRLLPLSPVQRQAGSAGVALPGHGGPSGPAAPPVVPSQDGTSPEQVAPAEPVDVTIEGPVPASGPRVIRARLDGRPWAPLKIASGCDRRCAFCAIPSFRGAFVSRRPMDIVAEARWLGERGVKELFLVSENSTSYGKDLGDIGLLEKLLPELTAVPGIERVRVSYLQPAEIRPDLLDAMASVPGVVPYFDISFQHASATLLRSMRRFGGREAFLGLLDQVRARAPKAGIRSNVIVGFPGETEADLDELEAFLVAARLDVVGVFGYSDEDGTEAESYGDKLPEHVVAERVSRFTALIEELNLQRAEERIGETVEVLVESVPRLALTDSDPTDSGATDDDEESMVVGRAEHQGPDVDGVTLLSPEDWPGLAVGDIVRAVVVATEGIDLVAEPA
ncbi:30S ribosomal protein S12 methylthiotransferase RimO [Pedococcus sp. KACC 23699]|uniref:Ribosomal protein uS12 methylthiotransferase RimO n=1 Tax=Pedococcus sp. KACC 23699 TaxID=3149228 RepID=A0AAU7JUS2_9MICO